MKTFYWCAEYLASFIECFMSFIFCGSFLKKNSDTHNDYRLLISAGLALITIMLGNIRLFSSLNTLILFVVLAFIQWRTYKAAKLKTLGILISYYAVIFVIDLISASLLAMIQNTSVSELFSEFSSGRVVASLGSKAILTILCITIRKLCSKTTSVSTKADVTLSLSSVIIIMISAVMYFTQAGSNSNNINFIMMLFFIVMLALILTVYISVVSFFDSLQKKQEFKLIEQRNLSLEQSLGDLENTFSMWKKSVHDHKNTVLALDSMLKQSRIEEAEKYLSSEIESFENTASYIRTGNAVLDTIVNAKFTSARKSGITFTVNVAMPKKCKMSDIHLVSVIGNLIDNAIEAEYDECDPYVHVQISQVKAFLIIKITNKCTKDAINPVTSKKNKRFHGIGLKSVQSTVKLYDGDFSLELADSEARATVMIPN